MIVVADASVALFEPPHFVAEVAAVLAREAPQTAAASLRDLLAQGGQRRCDRAGGGFHLISGSTSCPIRAAATA